MRVRLIHPREPCGEVNLARSFRLYEKKRGNRRTGSSKLGTAGEAVFFAALVLLGCAGLAVLFATWVILVTYVPWLSEGVMNLCLGLFGP